MTEREYRMVTTPPGQKGTTVCEFQGDAGTAVVHLPTGTFPPTIVDIITGLRRAYEGGQEDRAGEILGKAGLARAAAEVGRHEPNLHMSGLVCEGEDCDYEDPEADGEKWNTHVAYAVLQAAARRP